ncbi:hypothetical protein GCM10009823_14900 [Brevibacterium salitolerans]|uniref:Uncharacterized protein n=1 Tax=Brevibacterium salitolerans TaxID=1403566 RepID=A0ABP5IC15_9MICO
MVEEAGVVVLPLQRTDLLLDERIELTEVALQAGGYAEIHDAPLWWGPFAQVQWLSNTDRLIDVRTHGTRATSAGE